MFQNLATVALVLLPILVFMVYVWWSGRAQLKPPRTEKLPGQKLQIDGRWEQIGREVTLNHPLFIKASNYTTLDKDYDFNYQLANYTRINC